MKEAQLINEFITLKKRNAALYRQVAFCNTRMEAFERVVASGIRGRLLAVLSPSKFIKAVNQAQIDLMVQHDEGLNKVVEAKRA